MSSGPTRPGSERIYTAIEAAHAAMLLEKQVEFMPNHRREQVKARIAELREWARLGTN